MKILLITHGNLGQEMLAIAQEMLEKDLSARVTAIGLPLQGSHTDFAKEVHLAIESVDPMDRVVVMTDVFGGTPSNLVLPYQQAGRLEMITGLNLGMLMHLLTLDLSGSLEDISREIKRAGQEAILVAGDFL
ncbi:MAG: hypothetical protein RRB13_13540 [bacterium]|nr:hypothetical protein [bacterium]